uniref:RRM domain-containing protein n=1 Tax=Gasterosteus aculeatus aculeatus TaxID=481459 RepID=A0AAQ4QCU5_GASAC
MEADGSQATSGSLNDSQHDPGKMFIGGLSWQTSPDSLRDYFSKFGEIRECMVMRDPTTKRSRGFGFVTFTDAASVDKVLAQQHHELDSKTIDPKVAFPRRAQPKMVTRTKKIFVGGLSANTVVEDVKQYFEQFGKLDSWASRPADGRRIRRGERFCRITKGSSELRISSPFVVEPASRNSGSKLCSQRGVIYTSVNTNNHGRDDETSPAFINAEL